MALQPQPQPFKGKGFFLHGKGNANEPVEDTTATASSRAPPSLAAQLAWERQHRLSRTVAPNGQLAYDFNAEAPEPPVPEPRVPAAAAADVAEASVRAPIPAYNDQLVQEPFQAFISGNDPAVNQYSTHISKEQLEASIEDSVNQADDLKLKCFMYADKLKENEIYAAVHKVLCGLMKDLNVFVLQWRNLKSSAVTNHFLHTAMANEAAMKAMSYEHKFARLQSNSRRLFERLAAELQRDASIDLDGGDGDESEVDEEKLFKGRTDDGTNDRKKGASGASKGSGTASGSAKGEAGGKGESRKNTTGKGGAKKGGSGEAVRGGAKRGEAGEAVKGRAKRGESGFAVKGGGKGVPKTSPAVAKAGKALRTVDEYVDELRKNRAATTTSASASTATSAVPVAAKALLRPKAKAKKRSRAEAKAHKDSEESSFSEETKAKLALISSDSDDDEAPLLKRPAAEQGIDLQ